MLPNFTIFSKEMVLFNIVIAQPKTRSIEQQKSNHDLYVIAKFLSCNDKSFHENTYIYVCVFIYTS